MKQIDYGTGSISKNIMRAAGPMIAAQVLSLLYNVVDRMYIGRIEGVGMQALAGVGLCFPLISLINAFANLYASGGASLCAIESGRKNHQKAENYINTSFALIVITAILLSVFGFVFCEKILYAFGASQTTILYALPYMQIYIIGTLFSMISLGLNPFINAQGYPTIGMVTILIGAILNIVLDPIFIFSFHLGIQGAAIASVLAQIVSAIFVLRFLTSKKAEYRLRFFSLGVAEFWDCTKNIVSLGMAGFVMQCTNSLVQIISNNVLNQYGGDLYISIMTIVNSVRQILDTIIFGLADGTSPILSYNYGARYYKRVKKTIWALTAIACLYTSVVWILVLAFPALFIQLFNQEPQLIELCIPALRLYFFAFFFQALQYAGQTTFKALNKRNQAIFFSLFRKVIIVIPLTLWLPNLFNMGAIGVFAAEPISNFVGGSICFITMLVTVFPELNQANEYEKF
ncbi:MATE family efflux transporter [Dubosiella newyorkensis]|uniref:Multidrug export protein MepA n=1 Tax=Dubosiella newyorkensis TaxID=1862672 RepID=A0A1U7NP41_9FIRM|nr:MATE family efflux transporter [Dubosiella newyorkensis]OLU47253.1 MATE family efflux transporter [Dubosiella newyorkensis]